MDRRKLAALLIVSVVALSAVAGTVAAYMFRRAEKQENVSVAKVACSVEADFSNGKVTVKNNGDIAAYLRVRFVTYWVNASGERIYRQAEALNVSYDTENWLKVGDIYYYRFAVQPDQPTENLLTGALNTKTAENGDRQVVELLAEAIQAKPTDAVTEAWKVNVSDAVTEAWKVNVSDGKITGN